MSKKNNSKFLNYSFLFLILTIGMPFQSFSIPTNFEFDFEYNGNLLIANMLLGQSEVRNGKVIFEGDSIFDLKTWQLPTVDLKIESRENLAYGQVFTNSTTGERDDPLDDVLVGRSATMETVQIGERKFITSTKPLWIQNNEGVFVESIVNEDSEGIQVESAKFSYYYGKDTCAMTVFEGGRISNSSIPIQKYNGWVAKSAVNGTDNWFDLTQNSLDCQVSLMENDSETTITSVRADEDGIFTEKYIIKNPIREMKTVLTFFNNDTALADHKIAFTNVLGTVPNNFRFVLPDQLTIPSGEYLAGNLTGTNGTYYNPLTFQMENYTITDYTYPQEVIDTYKLAEFTTNVATIPPEYNIDNVTYIDVEYNLSVDDLYLDDGETGFAMDYFSEKLQRTNTIKYDFINDSIDKLWNVKIVSDFTGNNVYVDYMNINSTTPVGSTAVLDPATSLGIVYVGVTVHAQVGTNGSVGCKQQDNNLAFDNNFRWGHNLSGGTFPNQNESNGCTIPVSQIDITLIPDEASVLQLDFGINATAVTCTSSFGSSCTNTSQFVRFNWAMGNAEQILSLDGTALGATVMPFTDGVTENFELLIQDAERISFPASSQWGLEPDGTGTFNCSTSSCRFEISSRVDPSTETDLFETYLESGKDYMIWSGCQSHGDQVAGSAGCGYGAQAGGSSPAFNVQNFVFYDEDTFDLAITWEIFALAGAPQSLTCVSTSPTNLFLDWEIPLDDGGTTTTGYQIERSTNNGASFVVLEASIPTTPTEYTDTTAFAGLAFIYRVSAVNDVGTGDFAQISCGVAGVSDTITDLIAQNAGLGIVALDWSEPFFTGNTEITGYQIERTTGTPQVVPDTWNRSVQRLNAFCIQGTGIFMSEQSTELNFNSVGNSSACNIALWAVFDTEELDGKTLTVTWRGGSVSPQFVRIYDGALKGGHDGDPNVNFPAWVSGGTIDITGGVDTTGDGLVDAGVGIIQVPFSKTPNFSIVTESVVLDTSLATLDEVTLVWLLRDTNTGVGACCQGVLHITEFEIEGIGKWENGIAQNNFGANTGQVCNGVSCPATSRIDSAQTFPNQIQYDADILAPLAPTGFIKNLDGFFALVNDTGTTAIEYLDLTVQELTNYGYRVGVWNEIDLSDPSNVALIFTAGAPSAPVIEATPIGTQSINVDWEEPDLAGGSLVGYEVERKLGTGGIFSGIGTVTETEIDDGIGLFTLESATEYCYQVRTTTNIGSSPFSNESCATTFDAPSEVENLVVTAIDGSSVNMSFDDPLDDGGSPIIGFQIEQKIGAGSFQIVQSVPSFNQVRNDTGLPIGTFVSYRVIAFSQFGGGDQLTVGDTTDATPQAPQNFSCSASSSTSLTLNWDTPETFSAPTGYQIDRREVGGGFSTIVGDTADTATQFLNDSLPIDSIFEYRILGHTTEGDTDFTPTITCTTLSAPDFPPEDLQGDFTTTVPHQMVLAWDIPDTFGVPINSFRIERDDGAGYNEIASVSGSTFIFIDQNPDNDVSQKYRVFTVGTEGDSPPTIAIPFTANQTSHWAYEKSIDDTGGNKNAGLLTGTANFNNTGVNGLGKFFDGSTYITVDNESDYDFDKEVSFGITTNFNGTSADVWHYYGHHSGTAPSTPAGINFVNTLTDLEFAMSTQVLGNMGTAVLWKVFDAGSIDGETLTMTWQGIANGLSAQKKDVVIFDGDYSTPAFHIANGANTLSCVSGCKFPEASAMTTFGAGLLQTGISRQDNFGSPVIQNFVINTSGATDPSGKVTVFIRNHDNDFDQGIDVNNYKLEVLEVDISNTGNWDFGTDSSTLVQLTAPSLDPANSGFVSLASDMVLVSKADSLTSTGFNLFITPNGEVAIKLTNTETSNQIYIEGTTSLLDETMHFIGMGYNGNETASGVSLMIDGVFETKNVINDNLSSSILNNESLTLGATSGGNNALVGLQDDTRIFGDGTLDDATLQAVAENSITTVIPINATITIGGTTFADISRETPLIIMTSGYPLPAIDIIDLQNFTATTVNTSTPAIIIDGVSGTFSLDPALFNQMSSLSNYTAIGGLTNSEETFPLLSNFDLQVPLFTFTGDFFFQQQRDNTFEILSFNYTQTIIPFDLSCNFKATLFGNGTTVTFNDVFFVEHLQPVPRLEDVVVACIDPNDPPVDPSAPSFGGTNTILSFVSFGDTTGIGNFLNFTNNFGDFFGVGLPFLFVIILAAAFTGRSAPTGILIIGIALGIMWGLGILELDPFMWGIILVLIILGVLGGKKFL